MKILLLDDDQSCLENLAYFLVDNGYQTSQYNDPEKAILACRVEKFDVIITDFLMPGRSGLQVLSSLADLFPKPYIIMISACRDADMLEKLKKEGVHAFFPKPLNLKKLLKTLARLAG